MTDNTHITYSSKSVHDTILCSKDILNFFGGYSYTEGKTVSDTEHLNIK